MSSLPDVDLPESRYAALPDILHAYAFPLWKWPILRQCFPGRRIVFVEKSASVPRGACLILWGRAPVPAGTPADCKILRVEDGFLRSAGLGADLVRPLSWALDARGIYYDATCPSDLEWLLQCHVFEDRMLARAADLRKRIVEAGLTKYNVGARPWVRPTQPQRVILVPGQVESDASIRYGAPGERTNMGVLRAVRAANPEAYVVYKPHPDVAARLRICGEGEDQATRWCDEVVVDVAMGDLLGNVDEVHVMTSLAGFEALLRDKPVTCYGQPFYAGWGLTRDLVPVPRRTRRLGMDELVAAALIAYPLYMSRDGQRLITAEEALAELVAWRRKTGGREPFWRGVYRFLLRRIVGVR